MATVTLKEAQANLPGILDSLKAGEEIAITNDGTVVAQMKKADEAKAARKAGYLKSPDFWMAPDFDAPLDEFAEYM